MRASLILSVALLVGFLVSGCGGLSSSLGGSSLPSPTITSIVPNPVARGASVTITGTNMNGTLTTVYFSLQSGGGSSGTSTASSGTTTSIVATVPTTMVAGTYNVYVVTSDSSGDVSQPSGLVTLSVQ